MSNEKTPHILVVDDEPRAVELLVRSLRKEATLETAESANQAWDRYQAGTFDLIISDQRMPGMSGVDLLSRVAEDDPQVGRILLTGYSDLEATIEAINRGRVHAYLHKPCSTEDLRLVVRSVVERVRLERENLKLLDVVTRQNDELSDALRELRGAQERIVMSERLAAVGKMIAMIVHDLRSPIGVVRGNGSELSTGVAEAGLEALEPLAREIVDEAERMQGLCDYLLEASSASDHHVERVPDDLDGLVSAALAHVAQEAGHQGVEVRFDLQSDLELPLDERGLQRALRNLAANGLEAMPEGGLLQIETRREGDEAVVRVRDSGPGLPDEIADQVFEPFVSCNKKGGTGLGLAIVRKVVEDHEGRVEVEKSDAATGTCFAIHLPLEPAESAASGKEEGA